MPDKNNQLKKPATQNLPPKEFDDNAAGVDSTGSEKSFFSVPEIFKHLLPAFKEAFMVGAKAFKRRSQGITEPEPEPSQKKSTRPGFDEDEDEKESLPAQKAGFFKSKLIAFKQIIAILNPFQKPVTNIPAQENAAGENDEIEETETDAGPKKRKFVIAFLIALIIIIPVCGGLYLGGIFDGDATESGKPVSTAPQENSLLGGVFDAIFGKKNSAPATPQEQLAAMHITYNPNNFVKYAGQNNIDVVKLFIQSGMHPDTRRPIDGFTPLTAAAVFDRQEMAQFLLDDNGADVNAKDNDGQTALMKAVRRNRPQMAELLLERKADYNIVDKEGNTALSLANEHPGNNQLKKVFERYNLDISTAKKMPAIASPDKMPAQMKQSQYVEISVQEFIKQLAPEPAPEPASAPESNE